MSDTLVQIANHVPHLMLGLCALSFAAQCLFEVVDVFTSRV